MAETSKHVLIYGPPAADKLTVARCLAATYGLRVLDNHLSVDVALRLFEFGTKPFGRLVERLRVELLGAAAEAGLDVASTLVFAHPVDRIHVDRLVGASEAQGGTVIFVQLRPATSVLERRITEPSRAEVRKLRDVAHLRTMLDRYDLRTPVNPDDLSVDNSALSPGEVAAVIARHAGLRLVLPPLRTDEFDVPAGSHEEVLEVFSIRGDDVVTVRRKHDDGRIDHVSQAGARQQFACRPPERLIERADVDADKGASQPRLARPTPPHLTDDAGMGEGHLASRLGALEAPPHQPVIAIDSDQCCAVEYQGHADFV